MSQIFSPETNSRQVREKRPQNYLSHTLDEDQESDDDEEPRARAQSAAIASVMTRSQWRVQAHEVPALRVDLSTVCSICLTSGSKGADNDDDDAGDDQADDKLIRPCLCRGARAHQHRRCVEEWIEQTGVLGCPFCQVRYECTRSPKGPLSYVGECELHQELALNLGALLFALYLLLVGLAVCYNFATAAHGECDLPAGGGEKLNLASGPAGFVVSNWHDLERLVDCRRATLLDSEGRSWPSIALFSIVCVGTCLLLMGVLSLCLKTIFRHYLAYRVWRQTNFRVSVKPYQHQGGATADLVVSGMQVATSAQSSGTAGGAPAAPEQAARA